MPRINLFIIFKTREEEKEEKLDLKYVVPGKSNAI